MSFAVKHKHTVTVQSGVEKFGKGSEGKCQEKDKLNINLHTVLFLVLTFLFRWPREDAVTALT